MAPLAPSRPGPVSVTRYVTGAAFHLAGTRSPILARDRASRPRRPRRRDGVRRRYRAVRHRSARIPRCGWVSQSAAIVAHPIAKAAAVVALLAGGVGDSILVAHGKDVRPLRLLFGREGVEPSRKSWIEVRAHQGAFVVEGVPGALQRAPVPRGQLAGRYAALVADARFGKASPVDVLVDDDLTAQGLIDVLVALDRAGARSIAVGHVPGSQATLRGSSR